MAKIVNLSPQERAVREQQAARKLTARKAPFSQEAIYQEAYGEPNVLFESDYVKPEQKKKLQEYAKGVYDAFGNIRKGVFVTPEEERYQRQLEGIIGEEYDPVTRQKLISGIKGYRDTSLGAETGRRFGQYQTERAQILGEVSGGQQLLDRTYNAMLKAEEQARKEAAAAARRGGGSGARKSSASLTQLKSAAAVGNKMLKEGKDWGEVWNEIKGMFPDADDSEIDFYLGGEEGAQYWGGGKMEEGGGQGGGYEDYFAENDKEYNKAIQSVLKELQDDGMEWADAFNYIKAAFPQVSDAQIDKDLVADIYRPDPEEEEEGFFSKIGGAFGKFFPG